MPRKVINGDLRPHWQTADGSVRLYLGDVREVLRRMPARSVHCCVTSPPYWGLRAYATGDAKHLELGAEPSPDCGTQGQAQCGACFVCNMVAVFRGVRRVLRDDGTLWLNLGDTYGGGKVGRTDLDRVGQDGLHFGGRAPFQGCGKSMLAPGNLVGVPWRVALALQADGWVLRQDIIWSKPSPMPESVRNRCTKAHEYVFLLTKRMGYFCDMEAIKERAISKPHARGGVERNGQADGPMDRGGASQYDAAEQDRVYGDDGRSNKRSVWTVSSQGYAGAHFATYPPKLIEPMILAGTSAAGCCAVCGAPLERVVERKFVGSYHGHHAVGVEYGLRQDDGPPSSTYTPPRTQGWAFACRCDAGIVPCTVLDPFMGSGTTAAVAVALGRRAVGIDLSREYIEQHQAKRVNEALAARPHGKTREGLKVYEASVDPPAQVLEF